MLANYEIFTTILKIRVNYIYQFILYFLNILLNGKHLTVVER